VRLAVFSAIALVATWPLLSTADSMNDFRDTQYFTLFEEAARLSVAKYHELPLWNPYYCGGTYLLGTPSARFVSPTFLATLAFGVVRADALIAFAMSVVGMEGLWRYARSRGAPAYAAMLAAPAFALSGLFAHNPLLGWSNFYSFELIPWAAFGLRRALAGSVRGAVIAGLAVTWMIGHGGTYPAPMTLLVGLVELASWLALRRRWRQPRAIAAALGMATLAGLLAAGGSMVRLWPVAQVLMAGPRLLGTTEGHSFFKLGQMLFDGDYLVGAVALPAVLVGVLRPRARPLVIAGLLLGWLAMGYAIRPSAFELLRKIPPYTMLRSPERFLTLFAIYYAVVAALGTRALEAWTRRRRRAPWPALVACGLLVLNLVPLFVNQHRRLAERKLMAPPSDVAGEFRQARGNRWLSAFYPGIGRGTLSCFDDYDIPQSAALRGDLPNEEQLQDATAGTVKRVSWSPNRIELHAELARPARIVVNQNWHPGWRASVGTVVDDEGRMAVDVPAGSQDVTLRFLPRSAVGGGCATLLALAVCALLWRRWKGGTGPSTRRQWASTFAFAAVPLFAPLCAFAFMHEPAPPPPRLVTPTGEPIVADDLPEGTIRLHARLEGGVTLEGATARMEGKPGEPALALELDWKLDSHVERGLGVFIHVEGEGMDNINVDHVRISGVTPLEDLPLGVTLRDVVPLIAVPAPKKSTAVRIYVGLWRARGDGSRLQVLDGGGAKVDGNRVLAAAVTMP
jgi:hypothetical protein